MKKLFSILILSSLLNYSCKKLDGKMEQVDEDAISNVLKIKSIQQMKNSYALLNSDEKLESWNRHFESFISSNDLTKDQLKFISNFKKQWLQKELFDKTSKRIQKFNLEVPKIKHDAILLFGVKDTYLLFFDLRLHKKNSATLLYSRVGDLDVDIIDDDGVTTSDCKCSQSDPYCNVGNCENNGCNSSNLGCGTLWLYSCDGVCKFL